MPRTSFKNLLAQHELPQSFIYLAPIFPIVQVMWADGRNQMPERARLQLMLEAHCIALSELVDGIELVSKADREKFDLMFVASKPDFDLLNDFGEMAAELLAKEQFESPSNEGNGALDSKDRLIGACMEIAAACAMNYPSPENELTQRRIVDEERKLIVNVVKLFEEEG